MKVRIVYPYPMLILEHENDYKRYLVVSDLHIGFESSFNAKGIKLDNSYMQEMLNDIISIFHRLECTDLVLLGDIKDSIGKVSRTEWLNIPYFFTELLKHINSSNIHIIKGNHDSSIDKLLPTDIRYASKTMLILDDTLLFHGHTMPRIRLDRLKRVVMGHVHPILLKRDSIIHGERVWIIMKVRVNTDECNGYNINNLSHYTSYDNNIIDIIVMPSFNRYITAIKDRSKRAVPLFRRLICNNNNIVKAAILTLNGSIIGDENSLNYVISDY
jgi:putative SbcD/Mre11-related phosphoesterase